MAGIKVAAFMNQDSFETPVLAKYLIVEQTVLRCVVAVEPVIGVHDGADLTLLN
jgi:hypothetical protein